MWWESAGISLVLIALAEIGDKSQFVCIALTARHGRARLVLLGAVAAFSLLNTVAVLFGSALATWIPQTWVLGAMATLFAVFGIQFLMQAAEDNNETESEVSGHSLFVTAFLMIFLAELGDKTQITVAGLASLYPAFAVWVGATVALTITSAAAVLVGKTVLRRLPMIWLHWLAGALFLAMSGLAIWRLVKIY